ncbi:MAG: hypothetical protein ACOYLX_17805 [Burkholderiaceae bacterium]|jgi:outer membrane lipoprotein SlyB
MPRTFRLLLALLMAAALSACSSVPKTGFSGEGTVQSIREISEPSTFATLAGAIGGAAVGGGIGASIGSGSGQVLAASVLTVVTGTLGATAANWLGSKMRYEVLVRFDDGIDRGYRVDAPPAFRPGARVRVTDGALESAAR